MYPEEMPRYEEESFDLAAGRNEWPPATEELPDSLAWGEEVAPPVPKTRRRGTLEPGVERPQLPITPQQKLLLLDAWQRSGLPARDFGALVNISHHTL